MYLAAALFFFTVSLTFMLPLDALPPTACCATVKLHAGGWVMQRWRGLAVVACVVLGMSGAARADWLNDAAAAHARGDYRAAINILKPRADQGFAQAQYNLGLMYANGLGVAQDYKASVKWYTLAAEQGLALAQNNLGDMHAHGRGVAQDYVKAHMWFNIAAIDGISQNAAPNRDAIAKKMTPAQIARAQELAAKCVAQSFKNCGS